MLQFMGWQRVGPNLVTEQQHGNKQHWQKITEQEAGSVWLPCSTSVHSASSTFRRLDTQDKGYQGLGLRAKQLRWGTGRLRGKTVFLFVGTMPVRQVPHVPLEIKRAVHLHGLFKALNWPYGHRPHLSKEHRAASNPGEPKSSPAIDCQVTLGKYVTPNLLICEMHTAWAKHMR